MLILWPMFLSPLSLKGVFISLSLNKSSLNALQFSYKTWVLLAKLYQKHYDTLKFKSEVFVVWQNSIFEWCSIVARENILLLFIYLIFYSVPYIINYFNLFFLISLFNFFYKESLIETTFLLQKTPWTMTVIYEAMNA